MQPIDLKSFERRLKLRNITPNDFPAIQALHESCFPGMLNWTTEQLQSQYDIFPEGQICIEYGGKIIASSSSLIVDFSEYSDWHNWKEISDNGSIRNHDPEGGHALRHRDDGASRLPEHEARPKAVRRSKRNSD